MPCAEWHTSVDSRRLSNVELKSKTFSAVDSGACLRTPRPNWFDSTWCTCWRAWFKLLIHAPHRGL
eukprot:335169-Pyramimonas_sp.AAC.1